MLKVIKRDSTVVDYNIDKIKNVIEKALSASNTNGVDLELITDKVVKRVSSSATSNTIDVEEIQNIIEHVLHEEGYFDALKIFILYREQHKKSRDTKTLLDYKKIVDDYLNSSDWRVKESASVGKNIGGLMLHANGAITANYWLSEIYDKEISDAHKSGDIHIHDLSILSPYCFTGDTKVKCLDGNSYSFKELVDNNVQQLWIYAYDLDNNQIVPAKAYNPRVTKTVHKFIKIGLSNGETVKCTMDHKFLLKNGKYKKAKNLNLKDKLMPIHIPNKGKYLSITCGEDNNRKQEYLHRWVAENVIRPLEENEVCHHIDGDKHNNLPDNILIMDDKEHRRMELLKTMNSEKFKESLCNRNKSNIKNNIKSRKNQNKRKRCKTNISVESLRIIHTDEIEMYDMSVPKYENFALESNIFVHNCAGWSLKQLIQEGLGGVTGKITSAPAKHLQSLCSQMVNFLGIMQNEWAGAQAFSSFDTYLAPFVKIDNLSYNETKQAIQSFIYGINIPSRWGSQAPFSNITLDWTVPADLAELPAIVGGEEQDFKYKDCTKEMAMVNKAFLEIMIEGDANGRGFQYPIPTYSITKEFDWSDSENLELLFEMTSKYGTPYFSNYINSDMEPSDVRSMCPLTEDTSIMIHNGSNIVNLPIKYIYDNYDKVKVWSPYSKKWVFGKPIKVKMTKVYKIVLDDYTTLYMGENHIQPVYFNNKLVNIITSDLHEGYKLPFIKDTKNVMINSDIIYKEILSINICNCYDSALYCFEVDGSDKYFTLSNGLITHNCRLRLDLRELRKKAGGFFGAGESTGSVGVVTINIPRIAYKAKDKNDFYMMLDSIMDIAARSLYIKRRAVTKYMEDGLYPYTKRYLGSFDNHFSTIGLVGINEAGLNANWINCDLTHEECQCFAKEVLNHMRSRLVVYQEEYGNLYNLEATPAESTSYRLAKHDKQLYPNIITSVGNDNVPYYTNSSHLPVGYTDDIFDALDIQDELQTLYTSGTVFHAFLGEKLSSWKSAAKLVKTIAENYKLPYYTLSPTYSVCKTHGYLNGEQKVCPYCGETTEVYSRITGYYRAVQYWNDGKSAEYDNRKEYNIDESKLIDIDKPLEHNEINNNVNVNLEDGEYLITTQVCSKCKIIKYLIKQNKKSINNIDVNDIDVSILDNLNINSAPTLIEVKNGIVINVLSKFEDIKSYVEKK